MSKRSRQRAKAVLSKISKPMLPQAAGETETVLTQSVPEANSALPAPMVLHRPINSLNETMTPAVLSSAPTPWALLIAVRRRWFLALSLAMVLAAAAAVAAWFLLPVTWRARTLLHISANRPFILFETPEIRIDFSTYQRSQLAMVKSRLVLNSALKDPEVASSSFIQNQADPLDWLEKHLRVDFGMGPEILSIALEGNQPESMTEIVNAVRDAYMTEIVNKEQNLRMKRLEQLQKLFTRYDDLLQEKRKKLKSLAETLGAKKSQALQLKQQFFYSHLESLEKEMVQLQSQARRLQLEFQNSQGRKQGLKEFVFPAEIVDARLKAHPDIAKLEASVAEKQKRIASLGERLLAPENDPLFQSLNGSLSSARKELDSRREELLPLIQKQLRDESLAQTTLTLESQKDQLALLQSLEKTLEQQISKKTTDIESLSKGTVNMEWLDEEISYTIETHKKVGAQKEALQVEIDAPSRVSVLEDAYAVQTRDPAARLKATGIAGFGMFGFVILGVAFVEFYARRVHNIRDVVSGLGLRLFGVLPQVAQADAGVQPIVKRFDGHTQDLLTDSINATRTMLVHAAKQQKLRTVLVTSALKGEGKTLVSSHLAVSMVHAGFKTLLIDADLRRPSVHRVFDLPLHIGLSEFLRGEAELESVLRRGPIDGLTVMTAGQWDAALVHILAQPHLGELLERLKGMYDFIIIDSAPVLPTTDSLLIGQQADGVLFSVLCDVSRLPTVHAAYERMSMLGVHVLGAVVGGASVEGYAYQSLSPISPVTL